MNTEPISLRDICAKATPGPWKVRSGRNGDCFVEAPPQAGKPYGQEILGDDYWAHLSRPADVAYVARLSPPTALAVYEALEGVLRVADRKTAEFDAVRRSIALLDGRTEP